MFCLLFQVEFLANFVDCDNYKRLRLLNVDVAEIIKNREYLYAFMQFLKSVGKIHLLQFCMDIGKDLSHTPSPTLFLIRHSIPSNRTNCWIWPTRFCLESMISIYDDEINGGFNIKSLEDGQKDLLIFIWPVSK